MRNFFDVSLKNNSVVIIGVVKQRKIKPEFVGKTALAKPQVKLLKSLRRFGKIRHAVKLCRSTKRFYKIAAERQYLRSVSRKFVGSPCLLQSPQKVVRVFCPYALGNLTFKFFAVGQRQKNILEKRRMRHVKHKILVYCLEAFERHDNSFKLNGFVYVSQNFKPYLTDFLVLVTVFVEAVYVFMIINLFALTSRCLCVFYY